MTRPSDITEAAYEWADIFCDEHRHIEDGRELVARAYMLAAPESTSKRGGLTAHQRDALDFIEGYIAGSGTSPSIEDVRQHFGLASRSAAHRVVGELVERGAITILPRKARSITIVRHNDDVSTAHKNIGVA